MNAAPEQCDAGLGAMAHLVDLERYPLADLDGPAGRRVVAQARQSWLSRGSFSLPEFLRPAALGRAVGELEPLMRTQAFRHQARHNIYFSDQEPVPPELRAEALWLTTSNHTLTCDQLSGAVIRQVYEWPALPDFLSRVLDKSALYPMADPLARLNVMGYGPGDGIGWHFDRAEFTVTLQLQAPKGGGEFRYRRNLRSAEDPNYDGVLRLLEGKDGDVKALSLMPGTMNVFAGYRSPHRVTPVVGDRLRMVAVLSYMERPDAAFSAAERVRFYGRAESLEEISAGVPQ